jgi:hypothetical protein
MQNYKGPSDGTILMSPFFLNTRSLYQAQFDAVRSLQQWAADAFQAASKRQQHVVSDMVTDVFSHWQLCLRQTSPVALLNANLSYIEKRLPKIQGNLQEQVDFSTYSQREVQKALSNCLQAYIGTTKQTLASFLV